MPSSITQKNNENPPQKFIENPTFHPRQDQSLPLPFRLRLAVRLGLEPLAEAEAALLQGRSVPVEAMQWMDATTLWENSQVARC